MFNFLPMSEALLEMWTPLSEGEDEGEYRTEEIQPGHIRHRLWFPLGEYSGIGNIQFDGDPTPAGKYGQIIMYIHDPDTIYLCTTSFIEFFRASNLALEAAMARRWWTRRSLRT